MMDHALPAPVRWALRPRHVAQPGSVGSCGTGSHPHRSAPVRASYPRTIPLGASTRLLSAIADPTTTTQLTTVGGEVSSYSPTYSGGFLRPCSRLTRPCAPKSVHSVPVSASSAISRASMVARKTRRRQRAPGAAALSSHVATPRFALSPQSPETSTWASYCHWTSPVAGSRAITRPRGVPTYIRPSTTMGVASKFGGLPSFGLSVASGELGPVLKVHATRSCRTLARVIWAAGE